MIPLEFRPAAAADVEKAAGWYEVQRPGLGRQFLSAVDDSAARIIENPLQFGVLYRDTRRVLLKRFPYGLYFRLLPDRALVVACSHARRSELRWRRRT